MRNSPSSRRTRLRRALIGLTVAAVPVALVAATGTSANAYSPNGGAEVMHEINDLTGVGANAIVNGYWGHEGSTRDGSTIFSMVLDQGTSTPGTPDDASIAAALAKIGPDATISNLRVAYVLTSPDGSAEDPTVTAGEAVGQAFTWFGDSGIGTSMSGTNAVTDYGTTLSTQAQYSAWFAAGQHAQTYDANLVAHDGDVAGAPVSTAPLGASILNLWPDGTKVSEVLYVSDGINAQGEDIVKVGPGGKAEVAWQELQVHKLPADHSDDPVSGLPDSYDTVRTSALYTDLTAGANTTSTTTTLAAPSPASPQNTGTNVTFTAHVTATTGTPTVGSTVNFFDGSTQIGSGTLDASGNATFSTNTLGVGDHTITATYVGDSNFGTSTTTTPLTYHINGLADGTHTAITVDTMTATAFAPVGLSAHVTDTTTPATIPVGSVNFHEGSHNLGTVAVDASGVASLPTTSELGAGSHTVEADFTPTNAGSFSTSNDTSQPFTLAAPSNTVTDEQTIKAEIAPGSLLLSTPYTPANPLDVGALALNSTATEYSGSAAFTGIDVTDTRAGDLPWTLTALAGDLSDGGTNSIDGQNVGLTGMTLDAGPSATGVTLTDQPAQDPAVEPGAPGNAGLGVTPKTIAAAAHGLGAWGMHGTLTVNAPADTAAGTYTGTVTFTVS
jgi:hypothetical protein